MDKSYTPEEIKEKFAALPADVKALVYSADMLTILKGIADKHQLHLDKIEILEGEAADVMTGFSEPDQFAENLAEGLGVDLAKAQAIAADVNLELFAKIRAEMRKTYETPEVAPIQAEKSVVMPSSVAKPDVTAAAKTLSTPPATPLAPTSATVPPAAPTNPAPKPATPPAAGNLPSIPLNHAEVMLSQPTISVAPSAAPAPTPAPTPGTEAPKDETKSAAVPPAPPIYKTDPYREPPE